MDQAAKNYNAEAQEDDGTCVFAIKGCTDQNALNYNSDAEESDGTCILPEEKQLSLVNKFTGSLCGPCGSWGWTVFEDIIEAIDGKAVIMGTYSQNFVAQLFITQTATDWDQRFGSNSWPTFTANTVIKSGNTLQEIVDNVVDAVDLKNAESPIAQSVYLYEINDNMITINTVTKFFEDVTGNFYLGAYLIEDGVIGYQAGNAAGPNASHHKVLRGSASSSSWGEEIVDTEAFTGDYFNKSFEMEIGSSWNVDNIEVALIIWEKKSSSNYKFVNTYSNHIN